MNSCVNKRRTKFLRSQMEESLIIRNEEREMRHCKYWLTVKILKWVVALIIAIVGLFFWGCAPRVIIKYKTVEVPVKCQIPIPPKPDKTGDVLEINYKILEYAKKLETALKGCE